MATDLAKFAEENGVKYFMISFTDLFGGQRAKLVPARAIADMQEDGAGFAGFATWLDLTPAHPDMLAVPDPEAVIILPWNIKEEVIKQNDFIYDWGGKFVVFIPTYEVLEK